MRVRGTFVAGRVAVLEMSLESSGVRRHVATQRAAVFEVLRHVTQVQRPRRTCSTTPHSALPAATVRSIHGLGWFQ